ncbi:hypothetical protein SAY87_028966 [Trapa incisa]|uniref:AMP-binding enzyme C-terminal domain-containing protein n=1 Tax=Trapa incisa TaxID=236973 RepID=A0AAN7L3U9_9MYRT|nr:hypothetical protein SAY87_028966 [Trapa incisa]
MIATGPARYVSSLEVEEVLSSHSEVVEAAIVGRSDSQHVPCAFVKVRKGSDLKEEEIVEFCGGRLPSHMVPRAVYFEDMPKNSTGKTHKHLLRERANDKGWLIKMETKWSIIAQNPSPNLINVCNARYV